MDLKTFREIVDRTSTDIATVRDQPEHIYAYVGLNFEGSYQLKTVGDALDDRIRAAFKSGHRAVVSLCGSLVTDLIREHVILDVPLDPYYDLLSRLRDAARRADDGGNIEGDWESAIKAALDSVEMSKYSTSNLRAIHAREYNVAESAKALKLEGYAIRLEPGFIAVEEAAQTTLVGEIERLVAAIGGINVARRLRCARSWVSRSAALPHSAISGGTESLYPTRTKRRFDASFSSCIGSTAVRRRSHAY
jgi:hypothetical protein